MYKTPSIGIAHKSDTSLDENKHIFNQYENAIMPIMTST
jgi:hypothetical protein